MANEQVRAIAQNGIRLPMVNVCNGKEGEEWSFKEAFNSMSCEMERQTDSNSS